VKSFSRAMSRCGWLRHYQLSLPLENPLKKTILLTSTNDIAHQGCSLPCDLILGDFSHTRLVLIPRLRCELVIMLGFPPIVYPSSNLGGHLRCSHGWRSSDWRTPTVVLFIVRPRSLSRFAETMRQDAWNVRSVLHPQFHIPHKMPFYNFSGIV